MPTIHAQDLHLLATSRLEAARDGLLQATIALRNVPPDMYVASVCFAARRVVAWCVAARPLRSSVRSTSTFNIIHAVSYNQMEYA